MTQHQILSSGSPVYLTIMLGGILLGAFWWSKKFRNDQRLIQIYAFGVVSAFAGAKIGFLLAESWLYRNDPHFLIYLASGKTVLGALLGGYAGVEFGKWITIYRKPTGDWFASAVPLGIAAGRLGCLAHGCCLGKKCAATWFTITDHAGISRWPAPIAELLFNLTAAVIFYLLRRQKILPGQHFHLYLISYGLFRFAHEFVRDTPPVLGPLSGYHLLALAVTLLGTIGFIKRRNKPVHILENPAC
ncbi:MAG: prolipoprotein diacylglyceryl transferase [Verrucomicrobiales bacterium]|nr:prolipoprotein diacylglyceryl transferase [Verrucomicrobiales bacterium]